MKIVKPMHGEADLATKWVLPKANLDLQSRARLSVVRWNHPLNMHRVRM